ncbi:hypothetical protein D3C72_1007030 [compost metagenome]
MADALGQVDQQGIARVVAVGVVHRLETVQVKEQHGEIALAPARALDGLLHAVFQQDAVGQLGQRVVQGQLHQFFIGFSQGRGQRRRARLQPVVQHRHHQRNRQHAQGDGGHGDGQPACRNPAVGRHADAAGGEGGGFHARVMHADNGNAHDHRRQRPRQGHARSVVAQPVGNPQRGARGDHRNHDGQRKPLRVVDDAGRHAHGGHAQVVHRGDPGPHQQRAAEQSAPRQFVLAHDPQRKGRAADGDGQRQYRQGQVIAHRDGQIEGQHAHKVHRPDPDAHGERAARQPIARRRQPVRGPHAVGHAQRRI